MNCSVCHGTTTVLGTNRVLGRHEATYRRCDDCGFVFVVDPTWLEEAYGSAIAAVDLGVVDRMVQYSRRVKLVLHCFLDPDAPCLDYGGGYGLLVRRMRDLGYDFRWYDRYCENLFATGFEGDLDGHYALLTAFEVFEHLTDPIGEFDRWAHAADNIMLSTELIGATPPPLDAWSYYAPETGQHIAFFTVEAMRRIGRRFGLHFATNGSDLHLFSRRPIDPRWFRLAMNHRVGRVLNVFVARPSLLARDFRRSRDALLAPASRDAARPDPPVREPSGD